MHPLAVQSRAHTHPVRKMLAVWSGMGLLSGYVMEEGLGDFQQRVAGSRSPEQFKTKVCSLLRCDVFLLCEEETAIFRLDLNRRF